MTTPAHRAQENMTTDSPTNQLQRRDSKIHAKDRSLTGILPFARKAATLFSSSSGMLTGTARVDG